MSRFPEEDLKEAFITGYKLGTPFAPHNYLFFDPLCGVSRILDFGHGIGRNFPALKKMCDELIGYELPEMNEACCRLGSDSGVTLVDQWDQIRDQHFDVVVANLVLQHLISDSATEYYLDGIARMCDFFYVSTRCWRDGIERKNVAQDIMETKLFTFERGSVTKDVALTATPNSESHFDLLFRSRLSGNWRKRNSQTFFLPDNPGKELQELQPTTWNHFHPRRIRVAIVESGLQIGGAEWFAAQLSRHLDPEVFEVIFLCYHARGSHLRRYLKCQGINVITVCDFSRQEVTSEYWQRTTLFEMLDLAKPDVVLFPTQNLYDKLPKNRLSSFRVIVRISTFRREQIKGYDFDPAARIACCSEDQFNSLAPVWGKKAVRIPTGVDTQQFHYSETAKDEVRQSLGLDSEKVILFVGRLGAERKRLWLFNQVLEGVMKKRQDVSFLVVGYFYDYQKSEEETFLHYTKNYPITWIKNVPPWEMQKYYVAADALLSTSDPTEGLSNTVLQALASGVIPVTSNSSGMSDLVETGKTGVIVDSENPEAFTKALGYVIDMPEGDRITMQETGRRKILEQFDLVNTIEQYESLIREVLDK